MKENISVEATCCTHSLYESFRCVIRARISANSPLPPALHFRGGFLCTEGSHNGREPHATSQNDFIPRNTSSFVSTNGMGKSFFMTVITRRTGNYGPHTF
jgi:hypothetical protein